MNESSTIHLVNTIRQEIHPKEEEFTGAVFLTYTLNLNFFEQLVRPALDQVLTSNVMIIADPDGYTSAMDLGIRSVRDAGRRYVCAPIQRLGGLQHVKILLMAGATKGRLLVGSGNLTMHGYGRNLELFSEFVYQDGSLLTDSHYAFCEVWRLLLQLKHASLIPLCAIDQLEALQQKARWLDASVAPPRNFRIWHNYEVPIWDQFIAWRTEMGLDQESVDELRIISPYYDHDGSALWRIGSDILASKVRVYVDPAATNLRGDAILSARPAEFAGPDIFALRSKDSKGQVGARPLHAKAIIGIEANGSWCIAGSANMTLAGLMRGWATGGNLELVTFYWSDDRDAFQNLYDPSLLEFYSLDLTEITGTEAEPSERVIPIESTFMIADLVYEHETIKGLAAKTPIDLPARGELELARSSIVLPVDLNAKGEFEALLDQPLNEAEAACLHLGGYSTPLRWIDQIATLQRYGARTYHARLESRLESLDGANSFFIELMRYLENRIDPAAIDREHTEQINRLNTTRQTGSSPDEEDLGERLDPSEFMTEEQLIGIIRRGVYRQAPYDRNLYSLRDLLSLSLLRLTMPSQPVSDFPEASAGDEPDQAAEISRIEATRERLLNSLCAYIESYCKRYSVRLLDSDFVSQVGPELLFENHVTLGRVLLEFTWQVEQFTHTHLRECFWRVWGPLFWSRAIGEDHGHTTALLLEREHSRVVIRQAWLDTGLDELTGYLLSRLFQEQSAGISQVMLAQMYLRALEHFFGSDVFGSEGFVRLEFGRNLKSIDTLGMVSSALSAEEIKRLKADLDALRSYHPPTERPYLRLLHLQHLIEQGQITSFEAQSVIAEIKGTSLDWAAKLLLTNARVGYIEGEEQSCPGCYLDLPERDRQQIKKGELITCSNCKKMLIYWRPSIPYSAI